MRRRHEMKHDHRTIAAIHIRPRNIELTDDQLTNSNGRIVTLSSPADTGPTTGRGAFPECLPLKRQPTQTNPVPSAAPFIQ
jgi:hypothetical protein